jgi:hypothetical protein
VRLIQEHPVCFGPDCRLPVQAADAVYAPPCGHLEHPSAVWHGLCLMEYQESLERAGDDGARLHLMRSAAETIAGVLHVPVAEILEAMGLGDEDGRHED